MDLTPDQWLERLTERMDQRAPRLALLRSYTNGNAPLPEGVEGCREAYRNFQKLARTNYGSLVTRAVGNRVTPMGIRVGNARDDDDHGRAIWKRNRLQIASNDVLRDMLGVSVGYVMAGYGPRGARVTRERPEQVITEQDAQFPNEVRGGLKVYRDSLSGYDEALVHKPGEMHTYRRALRDDRNHPLPIASFQGGWEWVEATDTDLDVVPIVPFINEDELGEFEPHLDLLNRINWTTLQELVVIAMQAYRQRAIKGDLPDNDPDTGDEIDYGEMFSPGPGSLWRVPDGVDLWESATIDIPGILQPAREYVKSLAAVTQTDISILMPDGTNQAAGASDNAVNGAVSKAADRKDRVKDGWDAAIGLAMALEAGEREPREDVDTQWMPVDRPSLTDRADASSKAQDVPWRTRMTDIWQFPADQVDRMELERAADLLDEALRAPQPSTAPPASGDAG